MKVLLTVWILVVLAQEVVPNVLVRLPRNLSNRKSSVHTEYEAKYGQKSHNGNESYSTVKGNQEIVHDNCDNWNEFAEKCAGLIKDLIASLAGAVSSQPGDATNLQLHIKNSFHHFDSTHNCTCFNQTGNGLKDVDFSSLFDNITITNSSSPTQTNETTTFKFPGNIIERCFCKDSKMICSRLGHSDGQNDKKHPPVLAIPEHSGMKPEDADGLQDPTSNNTRRQISYPKSLTAHTSEGSKETTGKTNFPGLSGSEEPKSFSSISLKNPSGYKLPNPPLNTPFLTSNPLTDSFDDLPHILSGEIENKKPKQDLSNHNTDLDPLDPPELDLKSLHLSPKVKNLLEHINDRTFSDNDEEFDFSENPIENTKPDEPVITVTSPSPQTPNNRAASGTKCTSSPQGNENSPSGTHLTDKENTDSFEASGDTKPSAPIFYPGVGLPVTENPKLVTPTAAETSNDYISDPKQPLNVNQHHPKPTVPGQMSPSTTKLPLFMYTTPVKPNSKFPKDGDKGLNNEKSYNSVEVPVTADTHSDPSQNSSCDEDSNQSSQLNGKDDEEPLKEKGTLSPILPTLPVIPLKPNNQVSSSKLPSIHEIFAPTSSLDSANHSKEKIGGNKPKLPLGIVIPVLPVKNSDSPLDIGKDDQKESDCKEVSTTTPPMIPETSNLEEPCKQKEPLQQKSSQPYVPVIPLVPVSQLPPIQDPSHDPVLTPTSPLDIEKSNEKEDNCNDSQPQPNVPVVPLAPANQPVGPVLVPASPLDLGKSNEKESNCSNSQPQSNVPVVPLIPVNQLPPIHDPTLGSVLTPSPPPLDIGKSSEKESDCDDSQPQTNVPVVPLVPVNQLHPVKEPSLGPVLTPTSPLDLAKSNEKESNCNDSQPQSNVPVVPLVPANHPASPPDLGKIDEKESDCNDSQPTTNVPVVPLVPVNQLHPIKDPSFGPILTPASPLDLGKSNEKESNCDDNKPQSSLPVVPLVPASPLGLGKSNEEPLQGKTTVPQPRLNVPVIPLVPASQLSSLEDPSHDNVLTPAAPLDLEKSNEKGDNCNDSQPSSSVPVVPLIPVTQLSSPKEPFVNQFSTTNPPLLFKPDVKKEPCKDKNVINKPQLPSVPILPVNPDFQLPNYPDKNLGFGTLTPTTESSLSSEKEPGKEMVSNPPLPTAIKSHSSPDQSTKAGCDSNKPTTPNKIPFASSVTEPTLHKPESQVTPIVTPVIPSQPNNLTPQSKNKPDVLPPISTVQPVTPTLLTKPNEFDNKLGPFDKSTVPVVLPPAIPTESSPVQETKKPKHDCTKKTTDLGVTLKPTTFQTTSDEPTRPLINSHYPSSFLTNPLTDTSSPLSLTDSDEHVSYKPSTSPTLLYHPQKETPPEDEEEDEEDCCSCESCTEDAISNPKEYRVTVCRDLEEARRELKAIFDKIKKKLKCGRKTSKTILSH